MSLNDHPSGSGAAPNPANSGEMEPNAEGLIVNPRDSDVLCGRGGAALRHPGNQTYRRLVNLNKGLYITCLKTEKLKISRSIVTAIRDQNGRFLEKDAKSNAWYDIGDKKAVEKTSQALREGQPKLRLKIAELGAAAINQYEGELGGSTEYDSGTFQQQQQQGLQQQDMMPPHSQAQLQHQHHQLMHQSSFDRRVTESQSNLSTASGGMQSVQSGMLSVQSGMQSVQSGMLSGQSGMRSVQSGMQQASRSPHSSSRNTVQDLHADMLHRLTLHDIQTVATATGEMNQQQHHPMHPMNSGNGLSGQYQQQQHVQHLMNQQQQNHHHQQQDQGQQQYMGQSQGQQQMHQQHHYQQQNQQNQFDEQQQGGNRMRPGLSVRAALAQELGITESQLSLMSELSGGFGGSLTGIGSTNTLNSIMTSSRSTLTTRNPPSNPTMSNSINSHMTNANGSHMSNTNSSHLSSTSNSHVQNAGILHMQNTGNLHMSNPGNQHMVNQHKAHQTMPNPTTARMLSNASDPINHHLASSGTSSVGNSNNHNVSNANHPHIANAHNPLMSIPGGSHVGSTSGSHINAADSLEPNTSGHGFASHGTDILSMLGSDSTFRNALLNMPVENERKPPPPESRAMPNYAHQDAQLGPTPARAASAEMTNQETTNFDRRNMFAKMKYSRPPSVRSPDGHQNNAPDASAQYNFDEASHFHMVDSSASLYSNFSHMTPIDQRPNSAVAAAAATVTSAPVTGAGGQNHNPMGRYASTSNDNTRTSSHFDDVNGAKVFVETGKVVDHSSSNNRNNHYKDSDAMSTGSRNSIMSGLSRISDTSIDNSIFSDLSKKIGNVSTRSIAMSEMSAIELQELDDEDANSGTEADEGPIVSFEQQPALAFERQQRQPGTRTMDFEA
jgi:hypothetical protein